MSLNIPIILTIKNYLQVYLAPNHMNIDHLYKTLEWVAVIAGMLQVFLAYRNKSINFLFAILSSAIFIYLFIGSSVKLYAEALLQSYYLIMGIYGWVHWRHLAAAEPTVSIRKMNKQDAFITITITMLGFFFLGILLDNYTTSDVPYWDSITASIAFAGTWLLTRKVLENWIVLNISNIIALPLYIHKDLYPTALLTVILIIIAILGYMKWKKDYEGQEALQD